MKKLFIGCFLIIAVILVLFATVDFKQFGSQKNSPNSMLKPSGSPAKTCNPSFEVDAELADVAEFVYEKFEKIDPNFLNNVKYCVNLKYMEIGSESYGVTATEDGQKTIFIYLDNSLKDESRTVQSFILSHEMIHAADVIEGGIASGYDACVESEVLAFQYSIHYLNLLSQKEIEEIYRSNHPSKDLADYLLSISIDASNSCPETSDDCYMKALQSQMSNSVSKVKLYQNLCEST